MSDDLLFNTDQIKQTAKNISNDTHDLRSQSDTWLGKIDDSLKLLPSQAYNLDVPSLFAIKGFLKRSTDERDRVSLILQQIATIVEEQEKKFEQAFTPK
jgi:hypothetical protein